MGIARPLPSEACDVILGLFGPVLMQLEHRDERAAPDLLLRVDVGDRTNEKVRADDPQIEALIAEAFEVRTTIDQFL